MGSPNLSVAKPLDWRIPAAWLTLCVVWSSTWLAIKVGLRDLPPISYVAIRFLIALVVLVLVSVGRVRLLPKRRSDYVVLAFTGLLMFAINYALLFWGELHVSSGLAAILQASIPIFGMVFAHWMLPDEPLRWQRLTGALVSIIGVALICARLLSFNGWLAFLGGLGITIGAASAAFSNVLLKSRNMDLAPGMIALGWALGGERLSAWSLVGACFVLSGVWMIFRRIDKPSRRTPLQEPAVAVPGA